MVRIKMSTHAEDLKFRLMSVELLQTAKKRYTYRELSAKTGLPITVLSRYAKGHVMPHAERARKLWDMLKEIVGLDTEIKRRIRFNKDGYFENTSIIGDFHILKQAANYALGIFAGRRVTKVLTAAVDGVPLATMVASSFGVDLVIAKRHKEVGVSEFLEETYVLSDSGVTMTLYIPKKALRKGDSVLIVDDMIKTGETQAALVNLAQKAKTDISGVYFLVSIGDQWQKKINLSEDSLIDSVVKLQPR
jgi:adenine/guanine phosphoribosyltransferase-like PRPP-binding protein